MDERPCGVVPFTEGPITYRIKHYRERAELLRSIADELLGARDRRFLVKLAATYEEMAQHAARAH
jgi:hypothetical protein